MTITDQDQGVGAQPLIISGPVMDTHPNIVSAPIIDPKALVDELAPLIPPFNEEPADITLDLEESSPPPAKKILLDLELEDVYDPRRNLFTNCDEGSILHTVQMAHLFKDSKTFVDMKLKCPQSQVKKAFQMMVSEEKGGISKEKLQQFVDDNFTLDNQMEEHIPKDWVEHPQMVDKIEDANYAAFAGALNSRWPILCRKIREDVGLNPERYSLLYMPHPVVVPGGRFREIYYWDSYWIIRGLIQCEMFSTVKGMILNFVHLVKQYGIIPNGGRSYYLNRSQPPLLLPMVRDYVAATKDFELVREIIDQLEEEFHYWEEHHVMSVCCDGKCYKLYRYNCEADGPRPESYSEDYELAEKCDMTHEERTQLYYELKTGAETGWDYSSRWFIKDGSNMGDLEDTKARFILPVDLNSIMSQNAKILADFHKTLLNNHDVAEKYATIAWEIDQAIHAVMWNEEDGTWYDYDLMNNIQRRYFTPSNLCPLWTESYDLTQKNKYGSMSVEYLEKHLREIQHAGGLPTTCSVTGQQWDFPNCWPPLEHIVVNGLEKTELAEAKALAFRLAETRIRGCYLNFLERGHMFEKYHASSESKIGGGGEYEVQLGFGWTNGVALDFLNMYASKLSSKDLHKTDADSGDGEIAE